MTAPHRPRSKAIATWLAVLLGPFGAHRFYLHGWQDAWGWLLPLPTVAGLYGFWRMRALGLEDPLGNALVPWLGAGIAAAMLNAIVIGLAPEARWQARFGAPPASRPPASAWPAVIGAAIALAVGAGVTVATIAFVAQRHFEAVAA